jgi:hypothetical protein
MTEKETIFRSVLFLVIGILLLISLIVCIYIFSYEKSFAPIEATIEEVVKDKKSTNLNHYVAVYKSPEGEYRAEFSTKADYKKNDKVKIYYNTKAGQNKYTRLKLTSKAILICPLIGLILCGLGLFSLFRKRKKEEELFKTNVIATDGKTQQLQIEAKGSQSYVKTPEEQKEVEVKSVKTPAEAPAPVAPAKAEPAPVVVAPTNIEPKKDAQQTSTPVTSVVTDEVVKNSTPVSTPPAPANASAVTDALTKPAATSKPAATIKPAAPAAPAPVAPAKAEPAKTPSTQNISDAVAKQLKEQAGDDPLSITEDEIKKVVKDVLKEVIQEVRSDTPSKPKEQVRVLPNYYYISGTALIYEEPGKDSSELNLKDVKSVTRTINSEGNVVKLTVDSDEVKCILTNMKNIDLEQVANLLHNKMHTIDENFEEVIEHKEY